MDGLKLLYENEDGVVIIRLPDGRYYYGNGRTFGGFGKNPTQFLRFNPNMHQVKGERAKIPDEVLAWIEENK